MGLGGRTERLGAAGGRLAARFERLAARFGRLAARFGPDLRGGVAVYLVLIAPVLLGMTALAVDYGRVSGQRSQMQTALDTAALAANQALALDATVATAEMKQIAESFFAANTEGLRPDTTCAPIEIAVDRPEIAVTLTARCTAKSAFGTLVSDDGYELAVGSASNFDYGEADIAFMLDVSGSMSGAAKIGALKTAMKDAVDTLTAISRDGSVRLALAPYSTSLDAGAFAAAATGQPDDGDSCVTERSGAQAFTDAPPTVSTLNDAAGWCPAAPILPLTDDAAVLKARIDALPSSGRTAGHLGVAWSWYLISPRWKGFWPAASRPKDAGGQTRKAVVLMTDGMFNEFYVGGQGDSAAQAKAICAEMKKEGVLVYSVAFSAPASAQALLKDCASGADTYFEPNNAAALKEAYRQIADSFRRHILTN